LGIWGNNVAQMAVRQQMKLRCVPIYSLPCHQRIDQAMLLCRSPNPCGAASTHDATAAGRVELSETLAANRRVDNKAAASSAKSLIVRILIVAIALRG
jgi:hypothetical protein